MAANEKIEGFAVAEISAEEDGTRPQSVTESARPKVLFILWLKGRNKKGQKTVRWKRRITEETQTPSTGRWGCVS